MTEEQNIVYTRGILLQAEIELHGMLAENKIREIQGFSPAYGEAQFKNLIDRLGVHHNSLITNLCGY